MSKSDKLHGSGCFTTNSDLAQEGDTGDPLPATEGSTRLNVPVPLERELPLSLELRRLDGEVTRESFRGFGINE